MPILVISLNELSIFLKCMVYFDTVYPRIRNFKPYFLILRAQRFLFLDNDVSTDSKIKKNKLFPTLH